MTVIASDEIPQLIDPPAEARWSWRWVVVAWLIILAGVALRGRQYQANRSLWRDESSLSYNIVTKSWGELLFKRLDYNQAAPIGFLAAEKLAITLAGSNDERVLRFVPLLAGVLSLVLFYRVLRRTVWPGAALIALTLFAISWPLIYYSAEVKQFGLDVTWMLAILLCALRYEQDGRRGRDLYLLGGVGLIAIFFSHAAIFTLAAAGLFLFINAYRTHHKDAALRLAAVGAIWLAAFAINWFFLLRMVSSHEYLIEYWHQRMNAFPPLPTSLKAAGWYVDNFFKMFQNPGGLPAAGLAAAALVMGLIALFRKNRPIGVLLILPMVMVLGATAVQQYPFQDRMILFLTPILLTFIAAGIAAVWGAAGPWRVPAGAIMFVILLIQPLFSAIRLSVNPPVKEEFRPVLQYVMPKVKSGDVIYLYEGSIRAFKYYTHAFPRFQVPKDVTVIEGPVEKQPWNVYQREFDKLRGKPRVWVLFTHIEKENQDASEKTVFLHMLDQMGQRVDSMTPEPFEAAGYLYDFSGKGNAPATPALTTPAAAPLPATMSSTNPATRPTTAP